jgi:hypothetical protein
VRRALATAALALALPAAAVAGPAAADPPPTGKDHRRIVGILDVRVDGVADEVKESFQRQLEQQLDTRRYWLASRGRMRELMLQSTRWTEGCLVGACLREVRAQTGADLVLLAALTGAGTSFGYVVTLVRTDTGQVLQQNAGRCDVCTVNEATQSATQAAVYLVAAAPDVLPGDPAAASERARKALAARDQHTHQLAVVVTAVGVAALAGGLGLYLALDHPSYAALTAAGGGALAAGGLVVLTF